MNYKNILARAGAVTGIITVVTSLALLLGAIMLYSFIQLGAPLEFTFNNVVATTTIYVLLVLAR